MGLQVYLRNATIGDAKCLFKWRNDETVRVNSFRQDILIWEEHYNWLQQILGFSDNIICVLMQDEIPIGTIRGKFENNECTISYCIDKKYRKLGYGKKMLILFEEKVINYYKKGTDLIGFVKESNIASQKTFIGVGYKKVTETKFLKKVIAEQEGI